MADESKITSDLHADSALPLTAQFKDDTHYKRYVDNQIRGTQIHVEELLLSGINGTYFYLSESSAAVGVGDTVCSASLEAIDGIGRVTKSTAAELANANCIAGVVLRGANPGDRVIVATVGVVPRTYTGLATGNPGAVRIDTTTSRAERIDSFVSGDYPIGSVDDAGNLTLAPTIRPGLVGASSFTYTLASTSAALVAGDAFCPASGGVQVTKATSAAVADAGGILGIVTAAVTPGNKFQYAESVVSAASSGLGSGEATYVAIGDDARPYRVTTPDGAERVAGFCDEAGNVFPRKWPKANTSALYTFN